jgi:hypothetical protein
MQGYVRAQMHAYNRGCYAGYEAMNRRNLKGADEVLRACLAMNPCAGVDFTSFADQITKFYNTYPDKRGTPLPKLIDQMSAKRSGVARPSGVVRR